MISHHRLQNALREMKEITKCDMLLLLNKSHVLLSTLEEGEEELKAVAEAFADSPAERQSYKDYQFYRIFVEGEFEYVFAMEGTAENSEVIAKLAICQLRTLVVSMEDQFNRNNFIQSILLGNMLSVDIFRRAKKLHIETSDRVVFVIDTGNKNNEEAMEVVKNLSDLQTGDFVTSVDEHSVILVKDVSAFPEEALEERLALFAASLVDNLQGEALIKVRVGYGNVVQQIPDIARSYNEARLALEVGHVFYADHDTISYGKLGIGRLIYQLPMSLCEMYIHEVFGDRVPAILEDEEAMSTVSQFFDNSLNISETARQLYVHRNTLVYRLERIEKAIGLDIRSFDDAMTFRLAVMVLAHMREHGYRPEEESGNG